MKPTTRQMLTALLKSGNTTCASVARQILSGKSTIENELRYSGSFMTAVLNGDVKEAYQCADSFNVRAFEEAGIERVAK